MTASVDAALARLGEIRDSRELERRVCREAVAALPFARVMLSRVDESGWCPRSVFALDPELDRRFTVHLRGVPVPFSHPSAEARACADGGVWVAAPAQAPPQFAGQARHYVIAALQGRGGAFGLLHADHGSRTTTIGHSEREALAVFANGFARRYERAVLAERVRATQAQLRAALTGALTVADEIAAAPIDLADVPTAHVASGGGEVSGLLPAALTPRERDVAELMVRGAGNAVIARDLVIVEGTVKNHVKRIMRKLGAATRAEAIAVLHHHQHGRK